MKLATLRTGGRDGTLVVVNAKLTSAVAVPEIAPTLQAAIDDWLAIAPKLRAVSTQLENGDVLGSTALSFDALAAPLPRAYQWVDGSAYLVHVELVRKARNAQVPASFYTDPLVYQGGSDDLLGPRDPIIIPAEDMGIDFEAEIAVITDDVPMGIKASDAKNHIKLVMLANDVSLRNLIPGELEKGFGFYNSKPATAFSGIAVTPDELGGAWDGGKVNLPLLSWVRGQPFGRPLTGVDLTFDFTELIAHVTKTRRLGAGTIIGSGTVANRNTDEVGSSCISEKRTLETILTGSPKTGFLKFGEQVRIEMLDANGQSIFGSIDQIVLPAHQV